MRFVYGAIAPPLSARESNHGITVGGVEDGDGVAEGVGVLVGVGDAKGVAGLRVRVGLSVGVDVGVRVGVNVGGNKRVGVTNTSEGYSSSMAE